MINHLETHIWIYARLKNNGVSSDQSIPGWEGFHELCSQKTLSVNVGYLPPITPPPTEMSVICCYIQINRHQENIVRF